MTITALPTVERIVNADGCVDESHLVADGWTWIDEGKYATVFVRGDEALKIYRKADFGYHTWLTHTPNDGGAFPRRFTESLPIIYNNGRVRASCYAVFLERLIRCDGEVEEYVGEMSFRQKPDHQREKDGPMFSNLPRERVTEFIKAVHHARAIVTTNRRLRLDIHSENVMLRPSTGEIVLSDPLIPRT